MKRCQSIVLSFFLITLTAHIAYGQCYAKLRSEGLTHLQQYELSLAVEKFFAARNCDDRPEADDLDALIKKAFETKEKLYVEVLSMIEASRAKSLEIEVEVEELNQLILEQEAAAAHLLHASNNAALAIQIMRSDPTLAVRIADFNLHRYPESKVAAAAMYEAINNEVLFYKQELEGNKYITSVAYLPDGDHFLLGRRGRIVDDEIGAYRLEMFDEEGNKQRSLISNMDDAKIYGDVEDIAVSMDSGLILTGSYSDSVAILTNMEGKILKVLSGHDASTVALSPDGKYALTGDRGVPALLWDIESGAVVHTFEGHWSYDVLFSPDGKKVLIGDNGVTYLKTLDGTLVAELPGETGFYMFPLNNAFSSDGTMIATSGSSPSLWNHEGEWIAALPIEQGYITAMAFSPDGNYIVAGTSVGRIYIWNIDGEVKYQFVGHDREITSVAFSPNGNHFVTTGGSNNTAKIWSWANMEVKDFTNYGDPIIELTFHPDGQKVLASYLSGEHRSWALNTSQYEVDFKGPELLWTNASAFSSSSKYVLTGSNTDSVALLWNRQTGETLHSFLGHHSFPYTLFGMDTTFSAMITSVAFSEDERLALTAGSDRVINLWNLVDNKLITRIISGEDGINGMTFTPDGDILFYTRDRTLKRYNQQGELLKVYDGHTERIHALDISPNGEYIVSGDEGGLIIVHHIDGAILETITLPGEWVQDLTFSPDGNFFLSCSSDKARLWSLKGIEVQSFYSSPSLVQAAAFSPDGTSIAIGDYGGTIQIWPLFRKIIDEQVADFSFGKLIEVGLSISEEDFIELAMNSDDPFEVFEMYKYYNKLGHDDLIDLILTKEITSEGINAYIDIIETDFSEFSRANLMRMIKVIKGDYSEWILTYDAIHQLIIAALSLEKNEDNHPKYAMYIKDYAWGQMLSGDISGAEKSIGEGLELDASNPYLQSNKIHLLFFKGAYEAATQQYLEYAPKPFISEEEYDNFAQLFLSNFQSFESAGKLNESQQQKINEIRELLEPYRKE